MREIQNPAFTACDISGQVTVFIGEHHTQGEEAQTWISVGKMISPMAFATALFVCVKWT